MRRISILCVSILLAVAAPARATTTPSAATATVNTSNAPIGDCDDTNHLVGPDKPEVADNFIDDNCNGLADEAPDGTPSGNSIDNDSDGVSIAAGDCNDTAGAVHPGASEILGDFLDNDCNGLADDSNGVASADTVDHDGDGVPMANVRIFGNDFEP